MQQRKGRCAGIERLARQMQHDGTVLADRIQHDRLFALRNDFTHDVNALGFEALQDASAQRSFADGGPLNSILKRSVGFCPDLLERDARGKLD